MDTLMWMDAPARMSDLALRLVAGFFAAAFVVQGVYLVVVAVYIMLRRPERAEGTEINSRRLRRDGD